MMLLACRLTYSWRITVGSECGTYWGIAYIEGAWPPVTGASGTSSCGGGMCIV